MSSSKLLFHFAFSTMFLTAVNSGKSPRTDGVSFMKMVGLLTCSAFLHVEDLGLHTYSCTSVLAYCRA